MSMSAALGALVLAGSGEYTPTMDIVDRYLVERYASRSVYLIATSCAQEGLDVMEKWERMGVAHFRRLGIEATPLRIRDQADADLSEHAERIAEAGIVWFSGGSPPYLAQSFEGTLSFRALEAANRGGAAVAGSSGGLGVLNVHMRNPNPAPQNSPGMGPAVRPDGTTGLGLAAPVRAMAHFDRAEARRPEFIERTVAALQPGHYAVGVDEDTALVWTGEQWLAMGHKRVVVYRSPSDRVIFRNGERVDLLPPPLRASQEA
jgi:cyanophycinase